MIALLIEKSRPAVLPVAACLLGTAVIPGHSWILDLSRNFLMHALGGCCLIFLLAIYSKQHVASAVSGAILIAALVQIAGVLQTDTVTLHAGPSTSRASITIASFNMAMGRASKPAVLDYILEQQPDIIFLQEYNQDWRDFMRTLEPSYPSTIRSIRSDAFGIAALTRLEPVDLAIDTFDSSTIPYVRLVVTLEDQPTLLLGVHFDWPLTPASFAARNEQIAEAQLMAKTSKMPVAICGDMNLTPWSLWYRDFLRGADLAGVAGLKGVSGTWPGTLGRAGIAIDHCLTTRPLHIITRKISPPLGSDHRAVIYEVRLAGAFSR